MPFVHETAFEALSLRAYSWPFLRAHAHTHEANRLEQKSNSETHKAVEFFSKEQIQRPSRVCFAGKCCSEDEDASLDY